MGIDADQLRAQLANSGIYLPGDMPAPNALQPGPPPSALPMSAGGAVRTTAEAAAATRPMRDQLEADANASALGISGMLGGAPKAYGYGQVPTLNGFTGSLPTVTPQGMDLPKERFFANPHHPSQRDMQMAAAEKKMRDAADRAKPKAGQAPVFATQPGTVAATAPGAVAAPGGGMGLRLPPSGSSTTAAHYDDLAGPETRKLFDDAAAKEEEAAGGQLTADRMKVMNKSQSLEDLAQFHNSQADSAADAEDKRQAKMDAFMTQQQKMADDVRDTKIDPGHFFKSQSVAGNIFGVIAAGLGGWVSAKTGGPNMALDQINKSIDRDIAAQQSNLENKKASLGESRSLYGQKMQQFGDARGAALAAKSDMLAAIQAKGEAIVAGSDNEQAQANWLKMSAQFAKEKAATDLQLRKYRPAETRSFGPDMGKLNAQAADLFKVAAANGQPITPEQARQDAAALLGYSQGTGARYAKVDPAAAAAAAPAADPLAGVTAPPSTAWKPWRRFDGNAAHDAVLEQKGTNVAIATALNGGKFTKRGYDAAEQAGLLIEPGDDAEEAKRKLEIVRARSAKVAPSAGGGGDDVSDLLDAEK